MDDRQCQLKATKSLGTCDFRCNKCSWFVAPEQVQRAKDNKDEYAEQFNFKHNGYKFSKRMV